MDYDPAVKKNEIPFFATKWMQLETIILNEINQSKKKKKKTRNNVFPELQLQIQRPKCNILDRTDILRCSDCIQPLFILLRNDFFLFLHTIC